MKLSIFLAIAGLMIVSCSKSDSGGGGTGGIIHDASQCPKEFFEGPNGLRRQGDTFYLEEMIIDGQEHEVPKTDGKASYRAGCSAGGLVIRVTVEGKTKTLRVYRDGDNYKSREE